MDLPDEGPPEIDDDARQNSLHAVFATFDTDNDGYLSMQELAMLLTTLCDGLRVSDEELQFVIDAHDTTGKGKLQFLDFSTFMLSDTLNYIVSTLSHDQAFPEGEPSDMDASIEPGSMPEPSPIQPPEPIIPERKKLHRVPGVGTLRKNRPEDKNNHPDAVADMEEYSESNIYRRVRMQDDDDLDDIKLPAALKIQEAGMRRPLPEWTVDDTLEWLTSLGNAYLQYVDQFRDNGVDGKLLVEITESDLPLVGVENKLHCKKILTEVDMMMAELGFTPRREEPPAGMMEDSHLFLARTMSNCSLEELQETDAIVETVQTNLMNQIKQLRQDINFDLRNPQHV